MNRLGLKLGCLAAAIVIWIQIASTSPVERPARLPLRVTGLEAGRTIAGSQLPPEVEVRVRGSKLRLLAHRWLQRPIGEVVLDLSDRPAGRPFTVALAPGDVQGEVTATEIIDPVRVTIRIDGEVQRRLPVSVSTVGSLRPGYGYVAPPRAEPESVLVTGPARYFPDQAQVRTATLDLGRLEGHGRLTLGLLPPERHLQVSAPEIEVVYGVGPLAERTVADVPVLATGVEDGREVGVSPVHADVLVRGVADSLRALTPARLAITVAADGLAPGVHRLPGEVTGPAWVAVIGLDPAEFQVVVGAAAAGAGGAGTPGAGSGRE